MCVPFPSPFRLVMSADKRAPYKGHCFEVRRMRIIPVFVVSVVTDRCALISPDYLGFVGGSYGDNVGSSGNDLISITINIYGNI